MNETLLQVDGMTCQSCVRHVEAALCKLEGVDKVDVKLREGTVLVKHNGESAPFDVLVEALHDAGYDSRLKAA